MTCSSHFNALVQHGDLKFHLPQAMEDLVAPITLESQQLALENKTGNVAGNAKGPAPSAGGCRIEGFVRVKKVKFLLKMMSDIFIWNILLA